MGRGEGLGRSGVLQGGTRAVTVERNGLIGSVWMGAKFGWFGGWVGGGNHTVGRWEQGWGSRRRRVEVESQCVFCPTSADPSDGARYEWIWSCRRRDREVSRLPITPAVSANQNATSNISRAKSPKSGLSRDKIN